MSEVESIYVDEAIVREENLPTLDEAIVREENLPTLDEAIVREVPADEKAPKPVPVPVPLTEEELAAKKAEHKQNRADGTSKSWEDEAIAASRKKRRGCVVITPEGETKKYNSVYSAFVDLSLPVSKHLRFRAELREVEGQELGFDHGDLHYVFIDVEAEKAEKAPKPTRAKPKTDEEVEIAKEVKNSNLAKARAVRAAKKNKTQVLPENTIPENAPIVDVAPTFD